MTRYSCPQNVRRALTTIGERFAPIGIPFHRDGKHDPRFHLAGATSGPQQHSVFHRYDKKNKVFCGPLSG